MKTKVNSKIAPVERFGISTPARSRGSNRNSRLQKKVQIDQEVDPALRLAKCTFQNIKCTLKMCIPRRYLLKYIFKLQTMSFFMWVRHFLLSANERPPCFPSHYVCPAHIGWIISINASNLISGTSTHALGGSPRGRLPPLWMRTPAPNTR